MKAAVFRYIHVSDLHLCIEPRRRNVMELYTRFPGGVIDVVRQLYEQRKLSGFKSVLKPASYEVAQLSGIARFCFDWLDRIDGVIISGDLCTTGLLQDLRIGEKFLREAPRSGVLTNDGSPTISPFQTWIRLLPGNHDRYQDDAGTPNSTRFDLMFGDLMPNFGPRTGYWVDGKKSQVLCFVGADFSLRNKSDVARGLHYGRGVVYDGVLSSLGCVPVRGVGSDG